MVGNDPDGFGGVSTVAWLFLRHTADVDGVDLRYVVTHRDGSAALRVRVFALGAARVVGLLAARRVDVLHLHVSERGSVVRKGLLLHAASLLRVPVVLHCHGAEFADELAVMSPRRRRLMRGVFSRASVVAVLGEGMVTTVAEAGADPSVVHVVPNPVALPGTVPVRPELERVPALFLGRMIARKGASELVRAVASLPDDVRGRLALRMFGDGPVDEVRALVAQLGVSDAVDVQGWLAPQARDAELARAEVFVLPSHNEGLPMALLEAMAWGTVPLVTPVGGIPAVVRDHDNGLLVTPGDEPAIAAALAELVGDAHLRTRLGAAARVSAEAHDVRGYVREWLWLWGAVASGRGSGTPSVERRST